MKSADYADFTDLKALQGPQTYALPALLNL